MKPKKLKAAFILFLSFLYFVFPFDFLPDFLIPFGWIDDLVVVIAGIESAHANWIGKPQDESSNFSA